jgi:hypothetical protein
MTHPLAAIGLPTEPTFSKLKCLLRSVAERTVDALWSTIGRLIQRFAPDDCANDLRDCGYTHRIRPKSQG